jgi:hypothetical protein
LSPIEPGDDRWPARKDVLLSRVYERSGALRRQRQLRTALAVTIVVVLAAAVPALAWHGPSNPRAVHTIGEPPTTTHETTPETVAVPDTTTTTATTTTTVKSTTTTALVCRNSYNPKCGPFRWDPEPVNQPMTVTVTYSPQQPQAGQPVTFHLVATDDDPPAPCLDQPVDHWDFGDTNSSSEFACGSVADPGGGPACPTGQAFGPWTPPARPLRSATADLSYTYRQPGTYTATFTSHSAGYDVLCGASDAWASSAMGSVVVTVTGPPVTTTTTVPQ